LFLTGFSVLVCFFVLDFFNLSETQFKSTILIHQLLGIVLGLFLVFRVNSSYDRWWEGRKLWGSLVNNTRNLSLKLAAYMQAEDHVNRQWFAQMISNIPASLRDHLRNKTKLKDLEWQVDAEFLRGEQAVHLPNYISSLLYRKIVQLVREGKLTTDQQWLLDREMKEFSDIIGACERIKNTPIPYSYAMYIKKFIFIYLITLPFGLVTTMNYITIPVVLLISFILLSVELIAEEIEDPFGREANDLPLDELSVKIRDNVREILFQ
jgi:putative membrane protein